MKKERLGEMNFPQTPILSFLISWCWLHSRYPKIKMKEWGSGEFLSPTFFS